MRPGSGVFADGLQRRRATDEVEKAAAGTAAANTQFT
jgi:hypothetical protein